MTTLTFPTTVLRDRPAQKGGRVSWTVQDILTVTWRNLRVLTRNPEAVFFSAVQPIMFVLLFVYVFGGAINVPGVPYVDYLMPGVFVQTVTFGAVSTAVGLAEDLQKGLIERFRALPMARSAVLAGRTTADLVRNVFTVIIISAVGFAVGFRIGTNFGLFLCGILIVLLFSYTLCWGFATVGLSAPNAETAQLMVFPILFPLTFASSAFVPVDLMPGWLQAFAKHQPVTQVVDAGALAHDRRDADGHECDLAGAGLVLRVADHRGAPGGTQVPQGRLSEGPQPSPVRRRNSLKQVGDGNTHLFGAVAVAHGHGVVLERVEVDGDAPRCAHLVLASVALADALGDVVVAHEVGLERLEHLAGQRLERVLLRQRQDGHLVGGEAPVQAQHGARLAAHLVLVVGGEEEGHHGPGGAGRRLDHVRRVALVGLGVEVVQLLPRRLGVGREVEVAPVGDALELVPAPGEEELDVGRAPRVVGQLALPRGGAGAAARPGCRGRGTTACARRASSRTTCRPGRAARSTRAPSARTRGCGRRSSAG